MMTLDPETLEKVTGGGTFLPAWVTGTSTPKQPDPPQSLLHPPFAVTAGNRSKLE